MPDQWGKPGPDFVQVGCEAVLAAPLSESLHRDDNPAVTFLAPIVPGQLPQDTLRAVDGVVVLVVLAGRQFMASVSGVEPQGLPIGVEAGRLLVVLRHAALRMQQLSMGMQNPVAGRPPSIRSFLLTRH
jgi:hypothetical protein